MRYPRVRAMMAYRHVRLFELAAVLRMSDGALSQRLSGRYLFAPHERTRLAEYFAVDSAWLFEEFRLPAARHETAILTPAMEMR